MFRNFYLILVFSLIIVSCKSVSVLSKKNKENLPYISNNELSDKLKENTLDFNKIYIKKASVDFVSGKDKRKFKVSFVILKDSVFIGSVFAPMGVEVIRFKLSENSVVILDKMHKKALFTDYSYISNKLGLPVNFLIIQAIVTNNLFFYPSGICDYSGVFDYKNYVDNLNYVLSSLSKRRYERISKSNNSKIVYQSISIIPDNWRISNVFIDDLISSRKININYSVFNSFSERLFPTKFKIKSKVESKDIVMGMKVNNVYFDKGGSLFFKIPKSYKRIVL